MYYNYPNSTQLIVHMVAEKMFTDTNDDAKSIMLNIMKIS